MPSLTTDTLQLPPERPELNQVGNVGLRTLIGKGVTADVYLGVHLGLGRLVAVKIIHSHLSDSPEVLERFRQEAHAAAGLRHPNIVQVHDFEVVDGRPYIVMEYLPGPTLAQHLNHLTLRKEKLSSATALRLTLGLAHALQYAHTNGVIHRDVKPANIALRFSSREVPLPRQLPEDIEPVLMDFGVARLANRGLVTAAGTIMGTPAYMSPEQILGEPVDGRTDIYSLGIVLYQMLSGRLPFEGTSESVTALLLAHLRGGFPPLPDEAARFQPILDKCLAPDRDRRYATAGHLAEDLRRISNPAVGRPRTNWALLRKPVGRRSKSGPLTFSSLSRRTARLALLAVSLIVCGAGLWALGSGRGSLLTNLRAGFSGGTVTAPESAMLVSAEPSATATFLVGEQTGTPAAEGATAAATSSPAASSPPPQPSSTPVVPTQIPTSAPTTAPAPTDPPILPPLPTLPLPLPTLPLP